MSVEERTVGKTDKAGRNSSDNVPEPAQPAKMFDR
jgi:hypothetical protein